LDDTNSDLGSGALSLLDPTVFNGPGVSRIGVTCGKSGKAYIVNADDLGGYKQGSGGTDGVLQTITLSGPVWAGMGSYPLEGGYIYVTPMGQPTAAYKFGFDGSGNPLFTLAGQSEASGANMVGIGSPTITTFNGEEGTGILWITDPAAGLKAFSAVPNSDGILTPITLPATGASNKFQRPAFGDGKVYVSDIDGNIYCLGPSVASSTVSSTPSATSSTSSKTRLPVGQVCTACPCPPSASTPCSPASPGPTPTTPPPPPFVTAANSSSPGTATTFKTATLAPTPTPFTGVAAVNNFSGVGAAIALAVLIAFF